MEKKMIKNKILHLNTHASKGAIPKIIEDIINYSTSGEHFFAFAYGNSSLLHSHIKKLLKDYMHPIIAFKCRFLDCDGFNKTNANKKIEDFIVEKEIKIVHFHNIHGYWVDLERLLNFCALKKIKIIWTFHDFWPVTGRCASPGICNKFNTGCGKCEFTNSYPATYFDQSERNINKKKKLFNKSEIIYVAVSEYLKSEIASSYVGLNNIKVIYNGIDFSGLEKTKIPKFPNSYSNVNLGFIANKWDERKGFNELKEFIIYSQDKHPNWKIRIVGLTKEQAKIVNFPNVVNIGYITERKLLSKFYTDNDIVINLSKIDTFGLVNVETLVHGTKLVALSSRLFKEILKDQNNVYLINNIKPQTISSAVLMLLKDSTKNNFLSDLEMFKRKFSSKRMAQAYDEIYLNL